MIADNRQGEHILLINFYYDLQRVSTVQRCQVFLHQSYTSALSVTTIQTKPLKNIHYKFSGINYASGILRGYRKQRQHRPCLADEKSSLNYKKI